MYSVLLMAMVSTGGESPSFHGRFASCNGCWGHPATIVVAGGCWSSTGCNGCWGSSCHGGRTVWAAPYRNVGCWGSSCQGSSCFGSSCHGSSCFGSSCHGSSCFGSSCHGGYGTVVVPRFTFEPSGTATLNPPDAPEKASLRIELPTNATLFVDGVKTETTGTSRLFHTPALTHGQDFYYELRAEVVVDGKVIIEEKKVVVRAGANLAESFPKLIAAVSTPKAGTLAAK